MIYSGIYKFESKIDNRCYIGSSVNLKRRYNKHKYELNSCLHGNIHLQRFVIKYGFDNLKYSIIEYCDKEKLEERETYYINKYDSLNSGFNMVMPQNTCKSEITRKNMSIARSNSKYNKVINIIKDNIIIDTNLISIITKKYNLDNSCIYKVLNKKRDVHKGFTFELISNGRKYK